MWQNAGKVGKVALVHGQQALGLDGAVNAVKGRRVQVACLVVHARHDGVGRVHDAADDKAAGGAAGNVQRHALLHAKVLDEAALGKEVGGQLDRAAKAGADHGGTDAAVEALYPLVCVDLLHAVDSAPVVVLGAGGEEGREGLQARLYEEEGRAGGGAEDTRGSAREDVDAKGLDGGVLVDGGGDGLAQGLVEAEAAAIERHLVDIGAIEAAQQAAGALILEDDADTVEDAAVDADGVLFGLELALQLQADLDRLEAVGDGDGATGRNAAGDEGAGGRVNVRRAESSGCWGRTTYPSVVDMWGGAASRVVVRAARMAESGNGTAEGVEMRGEERRGR